MSASKFVIAAAVVLVGSASLAPRMSHAQAMSAPSNDASALPSFDQLDKANHGYITRSEIPKDIEGLKPLRMHFAEADTNSNGRLEKDEYQAYVARAQSTHSGSGSSSGGSQPMH